MLQFKLVCMHMMNNILLVVNFVVLEVITHLIKSSVDTNFTMPAQMHVFGLERFVYILSMIKFLVFSYWIGKNLIQIPVNKYFCTDTCTKK